MHVALDEHVPYLEERRRGRKVYFYYLPKGSARSVFGMQSVALAQNAPRTATYEERLRIAVQEAKGLNDELERRRQGSKAVDPTAVKGTLPWLIAERRKHDKYIKLSEATKERTYECWFRLLTKWSETNKHPDVRLLTTPIVQGLYEDITDPDPDTGERMLAKGRNVIATLRMLLRYAKVKLDGVASNAAEGVEMADKTLRQIIWNVDQMDRAESKAAKMGMSSIALGIDLAYNSGQRRADLVSLRFRQWNGRAFLIRQSKTGEFIEVPVLPKFRDQMNALVRERNPEPDDFILMDENGAPYTGDSFYDGFKKVVESAGLKDLWFHDLRRTCVVRLARAGLTVPQICAITGHKLRSAHSILEHYLPRDSVMAAEGIKKLGQYEARESRKRASKAAK
jgi:integrase